MKKMNPIHMTCCFLAYLPNYRGSMASMGMLFLKGACNRLVEKEPPALVFGTTTLLVTVRGQLGAQAAIKKEVLKSANHQPKRPPFIRNTLGKVHKADALKDPKAFQRLKMFGNRAYQHHVAQKFIGPQMFGGLGPLLPICLVFGPLDPRNLGSVHQICNMCIPICNACTICMCAPCVNSKRLSSGTLCSKMKRLFGGGFVPQDEASFWWGSCAPRAFQALTRCGGGEGWVVDLVRGRRSPGCGGGSCTLRAGTKWIPKRGKK